MVRRILLLVAGVGIGGLLAFLIYTFTPWFNFINSGKNPFTRTRKEVIGFLPYSLLSRAQTDYSSYITTLAYFSLRIDSDGSIIKLVNAQEEDPGWNHLRAGSAQPFLDSAKKHNEKLSLVVFSGDNDVIDSLVSDPVVHANNLMNDVTPVMKKYGFTDLNLDIESTKEATPEAQMHFTQFVQTVKQHLVAEKVGTLSVDISTLDVVRHDLIDPKAIGKIADKVILMGYDFHSTASTVTGPVGPLSGAGTESEYDVTAALQKTLDVIPARKVVLGAPLYGYEWETLLPVPRAAAIPGSGNTASNRRVEDVIKNCSNCTVTTDPVAQEPHVIYFDKTTDTYHQIFYPDQNSMSAKINLAQEKNLGGLALWALGYEGHNILNPLKKYVKN